MSKNAPLQNRLDERAGGGRPGIEFKRAQLRPRMILDQQGKGGMRLNGEAVGIEGLDSLHRSDGSRRERLATVDPFFVAFLSIRLMISATFV